MGGVGCRDRRLWFWTVKWKLGITEIRELVVLGIRVEDMNLVIISLFVRE